MEKHAKKMLSMSLAVSLLSLSAVPAAMADDNLAPLRNLQDSSYNAYSANTYNTGAYGTNSYNNLEPMTLRGRLVSIPSGTLMALHTNQPISSYGAHIGDPVSATLENDLFVNDAVAIPAGSQVLGQIANISEAGHLGKHGEIDVRFDSIKLPDGRVVPVQAHIVTKDDSGVLKGDTYTKDVLKGVGVAAGATGVGTLMGTAAGSLLGSVGGGAVFGLGVGALGGLGYAMVRKGKDVLLPAGSRMSVKIDTPVTINN